MSPQIRAEFKRVVANTDLLKSLLDGIDGLVPRLLEVYQAATKSGKKQALKDILDSLEKDVSVGTDESKMKHYLLFAITFSPHCIFLCLTLTLSNSV